MKIDDVTMDYLQGLAKIRLDEAQAETAKKDLAAILGYMNTLNELDTEGIEPLTHPMPACNVFRDDAVKPPLPREDILANAPKHADGCFVVPKTVE